MFDLTARRQRLIGAWLLGATGMLLFGLAARLVYINTVLSPTLLASAARQQAGQIELPARRGKVLDVQGRVVASSRQLPDVFVDPARVSDLERLASELAVRLNLPAAELVQLIDKRKDSRYVVVASRVDSVTAEAVTAMRHPAVGLTNRDVRTFPLGASMAHVLGFVGRDGRGLEGIELAMDRHLSGTSGRRAAIRDARRRALYPADSADNRDPVDGGHVVLTIDAEVQRIVERALHRTVVDFEAESGVAIVMSPTDGEVLALACNPAFDPNDGAPASAELRRNRALTDPVEPGSAFKPFVASGALDAKVLTPTEKIDCHMGTHFFGSRKVTDVHGYGLLDLEGIISKSSNIGMTFIAERLGSRRLRETIRAFGFGERTGIELPGESPGVVYPLVFWNSATIPSVAMGYEIGVTPLQLVGGFVTLINNGERVKPRVVKALLNAEGRVVESFDGRQTAGRAITAETARYMVHDLMASVVEEGTGGRAKLENYRVVGKTGTAKLTYRDRRGYEPGQYLSVFMAAAPADNPQVVALVMIRRPDARLGYYGGVVAAPAVGEILRETLPYLGVPPDETLKVATLAD